MYVSDSTVCVYVEYTVLLYVCTVYSTVCTYSIQYCTYIQYTYSTVVHQYTALYRTNLLGSTTTTTTTGTRGHQSGLTKELSDRPLRPRRSSILDRGRVPSVGVGFRGLGAATHGGPARFVDDKPTSTGGTWADDG